MQKQNHWIIFALALIVLTIGGITTIAIAAPTLPWEFSSADPDDATQDTQPEDYTDREPQPDEDGYTGSRPENVQEILVSSASADTPVQPDWNTMITEPQLDDNRNGESVAAAEPQYSTLFYYAHVAGSVLRPRDSSVDWNNMGNGGCVYNNGGETYKILNIHLEIPEGSLIEYLRIYYYDISAANDSIAWVTRYDDAGGYEDVVYVYSDADTGYGTVLSTQIAHVVDNTNYSYVLNWRPYEQGSTMALCGLRVAYRLPD